MNTTKILESEISDFKIASLPSRPTAPAAFGGRGYTSAEMKAAFDKLPLYIIERFNMLLDDIASDDDNSLSAEIPTGISEGHTLKAFFDDICNGNLPSYLQMGDESLEEMKLRLSEERDELEERLVPVFIHLGDLTLDGGSPAKRNRDTGEVII